MFSTRIKGAPKMSGEKWLSLVEVAERFKVGRRTIYDWMRDRGFPSHRVGGRRRLFLESEVDTWAKQQNGGRPE